MTATEERQLRRALHGTLESVSPPPVPLEAIVRRGRGVRLRRAGAAAGSARPGRDRRCHRPGAARQPAGRPVPAAAPPSPRRTRRRRRQRHRGRAPVAARRPGHRRPGLHVPACDHAQRHRRRPGVPRSGKRGAPWPWAPPSRGGLRVHPVAPGHQRDHRQRRRNVPAVIVNACGYPVPPRRLRVLAGQTAAGHPGQSCPGWSCRCHSSPTPPTHGQEPGGRRLLDEHCSYTAAGRGRLRPPWPREPSRTARDGSSTLQFGTGGDCYEFERRTRSAAPRWATAARSAPRPGRRPSWPCPSASPKPGTGATGYAVQVSPGTARVRAVLTNGSPCWPRRWIVDGRKYVAFVVPSPLLLCTAYPGSTPRAGSWPAPPRVPQYGYVQFQP